MLAVEDGLATGLDEVLTVFGGDSSAYPQAVTRCISDVLADPIQPDVLYALDKCQGMLLRLSRAAP